MTFVVTLPPASRQPPLRLDFVKCHPKSHPTLVPDLRLTHVNVNSCVRPQHFLEDGVDRSCPVRLREEVHIIQKTEEAFPWIQESVNLLQRLMLPQ